MIKRSFSWLLTLAILVALLLGSTWFESTGLGGWANNPYAGGEPPVATQVQVAAKDLTLVCPGSAVLAGGATGTKVGQFERTGNSVVNLAADLPVQAKLLRTDLAGTQAATMPVSASSSSLNTLTSALPFALTVSDPQHVAQQSSRLLGAQSFQTVSGGAMAGLQAANCQRPTSEFWLLGATTTTGREALLVLANPNPVPATVDLDLATETGLLPVASLNGISVPANRSLVLPLAASAPNESLLAVHVRTSGAAIAAWVQQKTVRGTTAAGIDLISPTLSAAKSLTIPGVFKRGTTDASALLRANADYSDLTPALAVYVPGSKPALVTAQVIGADSKSFGTVLQQQLPAGQTVLLDLPGLKDGNYAVFVSSDQPVLAAVRLSRTDKTKTPITDFAWLNPALNTAVERVITVPRSGISKLSLANSQSQSVIAVVSNLSTGKTQSVTIARLSSKVVEVDNDSVIAVQAPATVAAALVVDFDGQLSVLTLDNYANLGGSLSISQR